MALEVGKLVVYKNIPECVGIVLEVGETMAKVRWNDEEIIEWIPFYAVEVINV